MTPKSAGPTAEVRKAQLKLSADYVNRIAVNFFAIGVITPIAALAFEVEPLTREPTRLIGASAAALVTSLVLHYLALRMLRRLTEWT